MITMAGIDSGFGTILSYELVLGLGIGLAMAPATDAVMGALPVEKAGVGSAVNDTTRTTGGALGVAILGSVLASIYRGDMDGMPAAAQDSLSGALSLGDPHIANVAREAFVSGMHGAVAARRGRRDRRCGARPGRAARPRAGSQAGRRAGPGAGRRMTDTAATRPPGRPRSAEADEAIERATLELLAAHGYRALSVEQVARVAGVGKATIYRRHRSKEELVAAAVRRLHHALDVPEDTGSLARGLRRRGRAGRRLGRRHQRPDVHAAPAGRGGRRPGDARDLHRATSSSPGAT